jgi:hypothetical protein
MFVGKFLMLLRVLSVVCISVMGAQMAWSIPGSWSFSDLPFFGAVKKRAPATTTTWYVPLPSKNDGAAGTIQVGGLTLKGPEARDCLDISLILREPHQETKREGAMKQYVALLKEGKKDDAHKLVESLRSKQKDQEHASGCAGVLYALLNADSNLRLVAYKEGEQRTLELVKSAHVQERCQELCSTVGILKDASKTFFVQVQGGQEKEVVLQERDPALWRQMTKHVRTKRLSEMCPSQLVVGRDIAWNDLNEHKDALVQALGVSGIDFLDEQVSRQFEESL